MHAEFLLPDLDDAETRPFWNGTARGELLIQTCGACGQRRMPPRPMCFACRSLERKWIPVLGRGTVWSFVVPHPPLLPAYAAVAPYNVITVALDEDPTLRLVGNLVASADGPLDEIDPATITIGESVRVVFSRVGDATFPRWVRD